MKYKKIWFLPTVAIRFITLPATLVASCGSNPDLDAVLSQNFKWNNVPFKTIKKLKAGPKKILKKSKLNKMSLEDIENFEPKILESGFLSQLTPKGLWQRITLLLNMPIFRKRL